VVIQARHACMRVRGIRSPGSMTTSALLGCFRVPEVRQEFLALVK
jgi:GTP cyclohydrolase I